MKRRIIEIDQNKCNGCGACATACHEGAIAMVNGKAQLMRDGADCLGVGAMFSTSTKTDVDVLPKETLKAICDAVNIPVVAIGGLNKSNILELSGTGVDGVALVSAIFSAEDIESECRELRALSEKMVNA